MKRARMQNGLNVYGGIALLGCQSPLKTFPKHRQTLTTITTTKSTVRAKKMAERFEVKHKNV